MIALSSKTRTPILFGSRRVQEGTDSEGVKSRDADRLNASLGWCRRHRERRTDRWSQIYSWGTPLRRHVPSIPHADDENHNGIYIASRCSETHDGGLAHSDNVMVKHQRTSSSLSITTSPSTVPHVPYGHAHVERPHQEGYQSLRRADQGPPRPSVSQKRARRFCSRLMFETVAEMEYNKDDIIAYNAMAYREGHPTSSGFSVR